MESITAADHAHVYLGTGHDRAERRTWIVIVLCTATMVVEIGGGWLTGSIALVADGLHMTTHAGAMLLAALAYRFSRRHADDARFSFGTGKVGDLAGFTSAVVLAMIALLIGVDAVQRLFEPVAIHFAEAVPIAVLGLLVNIASAAVLSGAGHTHDHDHDHDHHHHAHRDNNMRAVFVHVVADAAVSVLVIAGLLLARFAGWLWMDAVAALVGAAVIAVWAASLVASTAKVLLDMVPDPRLSAAIRQLVAREGDRLTDLHLWRLGPGHLAAILSVESASPARDAAHYHRLLAEFPSLSHVTVELQPSP